MKDLETDCRIFLAGLVAAALIAAGTITLTFWSPGAQATIVCVPLVPWKCKVKRPTQ